MTPYEQMVKFEIGLEMGLVTLEDLRFFLDQALRQADVPYIYTDVFLTLDKGQEAVTDTIFYNLQGNYKADRTAGNCVQRALIGMIRDKYRSGSIDKEQCVGFLNKLTNYSDCEWNLLAIDEYYKLNKSGYSSDEDFERKLSDIFAQGV